MVDGSHRMQNTPEEQMTEGNSEPSRPADDITDVVTPFGDECDPEELISLASHELRNPLTVALLHLSLAREEHESEHLDTVEQALDQMDTIITEFLNLTWSTQTIETTDPVNLAALSEQCWDTVTHENAELRHTTNSTVRADRFQLQQLLENMFQNAVEHGGEAVTVTVGDLPGGFYVEDDGAGISRAEREHVFEPGYTTAPDGTGFGLYLVGKIADAHSWTLRITDGSDGGTRFEITGVEFVGQ